MCLWKHCSLKKFVLTVNFIIKTNFLTTYSKIPRPDIGLEAFFSHVPFIVFMILSVQVCMCKCGMCVVVYICLCTHEHIYVCAQQTKKCIGTLLLPIFLITLMQGLSQNLKLQPKTFSFPFASHHPTMLGYTHLFMFNLSYWWQGP